MDTSSARPQHLKRVGLLGGMGVAVAVQVAGLAGSAAAASEPVGTAFEQECPAVVIVYVPGSNETVQVGDTYVETDGILREVVQGIEDDADTSIRLHTIGYPAELFSVDPHYFESKSQGYEATWSTMRYYAQQCSGVEFELIGYSQGAHVAGDIAATIGTQGSPVAADRIQGVHLLADPAREGSYQPQVGDAPSMTDGLDVTLKDAAAEGLSPTTLTPGGLTRASLDLVLKNLGHSGTSGRTFGDLDGRVVQYCMSGDIVCDARAASAPPYGVARHGDYDHAIAPGTDQPYLGVLEDNLVQDILVLNDPTF